VRIDPNVDHCHFDKVHPTDIKRKPANTVSRFDERSKEVVQKVTIPVDQSLNRKAVVDNLDGDENCSPLKKRTRSRSRSMDVSLT
jgi:hypothetical protein